MTTIRELTPPNWGRSITSCMAGLSRYLNGWMAHYRLCTSDAAPELGVIDAHVRRRLRAIIVRQKKRPRFLFRHLLARKVSRKAAAGTAYCGKGVGRIEPARHDESLSARMVPRADGLTQGALGRVEPPTGHRPAHAGTLISTQRAGCGSARPVL